MTRNWKKGGDVKRELEENKRVAQNSVLLPTENWKNSCGTISLLLPFNIYYLYNYRITLL